MPRRSGKTKKRKDESDDLPDLGASIDDTLRFEEVPGEASPGVEILVQGFLRLLDAASRQDYVTAEIILRTILSITPGGDTVIRKMDKAAPPPDLAERVSRDLDEGFLSEEDAAVLLEEARARAAVEEALRDLQKIRAFRELIWRTRRILVG